MQIVEGWKRLSLIILLCLSAWAAWPSSHYDARLQLNSPVTVPEQSASTPADSLPSILDHYQFDERPVLALASCLPSQWLATPVPTGRAPSESYYPHYQSRYRNHLTGRAPPFSS